MKNFVAALAVVVFVGAAAAQAKKDDAAKKELPKIDAAKLVGTWEITKPSGDIPKGSVVVFDKDMKLKVTIDFNGKKLEIEGTYKVNGDKLEVTVKGPDGKEETDTDTIKSVDDKKLVIVDKDGKEAELEKKPAEKK
jgi:uncharacterized protein (TIGR03066 family)